MQHVELKNFGYEPDPTKKTGEKPDWDFDTELRPHLSAVTTGDIDLRKYATDTNQFGLPSCVGSATADSVEIISAAQGHPKVELSRMYVWTLARNLMKEDGYKFMTGTYIRHAFKALHQHGICLEKYWPYDQSNWDDLPSLKAMRKATGRKIKGYYKIGNSKRIEKIIEALQAEHPVVFGTLLDDQWSNYNGRSTLQKPKGSTKGGHAMVVVGYDSSRGFIVKNSWGPRWGDQGYCYMSEEYLDWKNTWDLWVPTMGHNFQVELG